MVILPPLGCKSVSGPYPQSWVPQREHRIDTHGAASRDIARQERDRGHQNRGSEKSDRVKGANPEVSLGKKAVTPSALRRPSEIPNSENFAPSFMTSHKTSRRCAPRARRRPISRVRLETR